MDIGLKQIEHHVYRHNDLNWYEVQSVDCQHFKACPLSHSLSSQNFLTICCSVVMVS
jgi:hypothetical protein